MMSYRLLPKLTISSLCIASLACTPTTPLQTPIITATKITEWETRLPSKQGSVKITFTLPETARAEFQLFDGKSKYVSYAKTRVTFTNENCVSGHLTAVNYKKNDSEFHIKYFEKEATWNKNNTVTMTWNTNNQITTALNDEIISAEITGDVNTLKIVSYSAPIEIQKIEYIPH